MKKEDTTSILVALIIAIALFVGGGYIEGGFIGAFNRASIIGGIIMLAVSAYFTGMRFLRNNVDQLLITAVILFREPRIAEKSVQEIEGMAKGIRESIETIRKVLR